MFQTEGICFAIQHLADKTALAVCTEPSAAPLDAGWYSGTREDQLHSASRIERTLQW